MTDVTALDLDAIEERANASCPPPWTAATAPRADEHMTKAEYLSSASCGDGPLWVTWAPNTTGDGFDYLVTSVTGDGPTSEANAEFIAHARVDIPALVAEVRRLRAQS